jgi:hypothetical protein
MLKEITHEDWVNIKRETCDYHDMYIDCPGDTISRLYAESGASTSKFPEAGCTI